MELRTRRQDMLEEFDALSTQETEPVLVWLRFTQQYQPSDSLKQLVQDIQALGTDANTALALVLQWLNNFAPEPEVLTRYGRRMLVMTRKHLSDDITHKAYALCKRTWG